MSDALGMVQLAPRAEPVSQRRRRLAATKPFSEETARVIDAEVHRIISESHDEAKRLLQRAPQGSSTRSSKRCSTRETLDEEEILEVTGLPPAPALESGRVAAASREAPALVTSR